MNPLIKKLSIFFTTLIFLLFGFIFTAQANQALAHTLSGNISDSSGADISGAVVDVIDTATSNNVGSTTTDGSGNYSLSVNSGTYNVQVTPPSGSGFGPAISPNRTISGDIVINFILVPAGSSILSGHVYDALNNPVSNQQVFFQSGSQIVGFKSFTDTNGNYSVQVNSGTYDLHISGNGGSNSSAVPNGYQIIAHGYALTQSTVLDIVIPAKKVDVHVQNASGNPIENVKLTTNNPASSNLPLGGGLVADYGDSVYSSAFSNVTTNASGNATLWLFPSTFNITATPSSGSGYATLVLSNTTISNDTSLTVTLQSPATLSGHVYDAQGAPVSNQQVFFQLGGQIVGAKSFTNALGEYSIQVNSGTYDLHVSGNGGSNTSAVPLGYQLISYNYSLSQSTVLDITIPAKRVDIHVQDQFGNPIENVKLTTNNPASSNLPLGGGVTADYGDSVYPNPGVTTNASGNATLWLFPATFNITAVPPSGSIYPSAIVSITVVNDTQETIVLDSSITLSGHVYDALGNPVTNQQVFFQSGSQIVGSKSFTDVNGNYSLNVNPGTYDLHISGNGGSNSSAVPNGYQLIVHEYSLSQSTVLDITIPAKKVDVHVQDQSGNPIENVKLTTNNPASSNLPLGGTLVADYGDSVYPSPGITTNASGNATLWLFPATFNITATLPNGSIYAAFVLSNVVVTSDQTEIISLQFIHDAPVTTANLATQNPDGTYSDPTTVTLSATAASGFTISNTYYTVDGGSQQTYSSPFQLLGDGQHNITFWSIDNVGVFENPNEQIFTINAVDQLTSLSPTEVWIGLKNSDDVGTRFDLKAEVYKNGTELVSSGQLDNVWGGSSGFNNANLQTIPFNAFTPVDFPQGSTLSIKLYVRNACVGPTHNSGTARLWYDDAAANSRFDATIEGSNSDYYLRNNFVLSTAVGIGPKQKIDVAAGAKCSPFKTFGTWSITP